VEVEIEFDLVVLVVVQKVVYVHE
ncbi:hypothetical protein A2U01_0091022, partial [Trifolium medium]|nr:hypothetical protein [Trifolium medium]